MTDGFATGAAAPDGEAAAPRRPAGITAIASFFVFGATMAGLACVDLLFPATPLHAIWRVNPDGLEAFAAMRAWAPLLLAAVAMACGLAARGLWIGDARARRLAIGILAVNLIGDATNALVRGDLRTLIGLPIAGAMIAYLLSSRAKAWTGGS